MKIDEDSDNQRSKYYKSLKYFLYQYNRSLGDHPVDIDDYKKVELHKIFDFNDNKLNNRIGNYTIVKKSEKYSEDKKELIKTVKLFAGLERSLDFYSRSVFEINKEIFQNKETYQKSPEDMVKNKTDEILKFILGRF